MLGPMPVNVSVGPSSEAVNATFSLNGKLKIMSETVNGIDQ